MQALIGSSLIKQLRPGAKPITVLFHVAGASLSATVYAAMSPLGYYRVHMI